MVSGEEFRKGSEQGIFPFALQEFKKRFLDWYWKPRAKRNFRQEFRLQVSQKRKR